MFRFIVLCLFLLLSVTAHADNADDLQGWLADPANTQDITSAAKTELDSFYAARNYRPAWNLSDDAAIKKTLAFMDSVETLIAYHGLSKETYPLDAMRKLAVNPSDADREKLEILITTSLIHLAHDLHGDSVDLNTLYTGWDFHRRDIDIPAALSVAVEKATLESFFDKLAPPNKTYAQLAKALQAYTAIETKGGWKTIDSGPSLRPEEHNAASNNPDPRVAQVRARLAAENYTVPAPSQGADIFDPVLAKALVDYQTNNGLLPDGHVGEKTLQALNIPIAGRIVQIKANMERWRHMPENFPPDTYATVNIPDFSVTIVEGGSVTYRGIVVDGMPSRPTPFIHSRIVNMVVNPSWHVPVKIARKDLLPKLRKNSHYLEKLGIVIAGRKDDPFGIRIDWKHMDDGEFNFQLRQVPGDLNSLGQLKFNFANPFDVYMHGTPHQELFDKAERDFSSGCVRLEDPTRVGEILLAHNKDPQGPWDQTRIESEIDAGETKWVTLAKPMPIYFLYWTVFASDEGQINFRKDIYGYDAALTEQMKGKADLSGK